MNYKSLLFFFGMLVFTSAFGQRTISGTITSDSDKDPLVGASILVEKTTVGTVTDIDGKYKLEVPAEAKNLVVSYTGMTTKVVPITGDVVNVVLSNNDKLLGDLVVTALGVKRDQKSVGYATQKISGDDLNTAKETNLVNSLQGKVAGVQITGSSNLGGSSRIVMRGIKSIDGNNQPLFVVDGVPLDNSNNTTTDQARGALGYDYGNAAQDINSNDIADMQILKGAAATSLYGSRGANGVILITTKKGSTRKDKNKSPIGVSVSQTIGVDQAYVFPNYQNQYGGGADTNFRNSALFPGQVRNVFGYDGSWGPKLDGRNVLQWYAYDSTYHKDKYGVATPWSAQKNNVRDFYKIGVSSTTSIALDGSNEKGDFRLALTNLYQQGTVPNSTLNRFTAAFNSGYNFTKRLRANIGINYVKTNGKGRPQTGYENLASMFTQWFQRQIDMNELKDYKNPDGSQRSWNRRTETNAKPAYWDNPYWTQYENYETDERNRIFGNVGLSFDITSWLTANGKLYTDYYNDIRQERVAVGSVATASYSEDMYTFNENNYEFTLNAKKNFKSLFDISAMLGVNRRDTRSKNNFESTVGGLNFPGWYNIENSVEPKTVTTSTSRKVINSVFGSVSLGYKSMLYLDVTGRNDWSSALPVKHSSYFYPSVSGSFVFTELIKSAKFKKILSYGKIRAGWAMVGNDTDPYQTLNKDIVSTPYNNNGVAVVSGISKNPNLRPEISNSFEVGTELSFLMNRITIDFTYYNTRTKDAIFNVTTSGASGFTSRKINAGTLSNSGFELATKFVPVRTKGGFEWGVGFNWAKNNNKIVELYKDENGNATESYRLTSIFNVYLEARPGQPYGQLVGTDYTKDAQGRKLVDADGLYIPTTEVKPLGSVLPDFTGGVSSWISWKGISAYVLFDFQKGGKIFSMTNMWGKYSGTLAETAANGIRENGIIVDGYVANGTDANGNLTTDGTKNTTAIDALTYFDVNNYGITAANVFDASFVKFREFRLGYTLPNKLFEGTVIRDIFLGFTGRNLAILKKNVPHIDPESAVSSQNVQGIEGAQLPTQRNFSLTFSVKF